MSESGKADLWLLGWTGDYNEGYNFMGTFFGRQKKDWGFNNPALFAAMTKVDSEPDRAKRIAAYQEINKQIMEFLPRVASCRLPTADRLLSPRTSPASNASPPTRTNVSLQLEFTS